MRYLLLFCLSFAAGAETQEVYSGVARNKAGQIVYTEHHHVFFENGKIQRATTEYKDKVGQLIGTLESNFTESLTAPAYEFKDLRSGEKHGIRLTQSKLILFKQNPGEAEEVKALPPSKKSEGLTVGCQGLHYYIRNHISALAEKTRLQFLIPGNLKSYDFTMRTKGQDEQGFSVFHIVVSNVFFKLFAPKLILKYDQKKKQLVYYEGISNIPDEKGNIQIVKINYTYKF